MNGQEPMNHDAIQDLPLESLSEIPVVGDEMNWYKNTCLVCLDSQGHESGVRLAVNSGEDDRSFRIVWSGSLSDRIRQSHADLYQASEFGACAIAFLLAREILGFLTVEQAERGTNVDFYLAPEAPGEPESETLIFNNTVRLEVSGILKESESNTVDRRVRSKLDRLTPDGLATFITIVEFSRPYSKITEA